MNDFQDFFMPAQATIWLFGLSYMGNIRSTDREGPTVLKLIIWVRDINSSTLEGGNPRYTQLVRAKIDLDRALSSRYRTYKTVKARFWPRLPGKSP